MDIISVTSVNISIMLIIILLIFPYRAALSTFSDKSIVSSTNTTQNSAVRQYVDVPQWVKIIITVNKRSYVGIAIDFSALVL